MSQVVTPVPNIEYGKHQGKSKPGKHINLFGPEGEIPENDHCVEGLLLVHYHGGLLAVINHGRRTLMIISNAKITLYFMEKKLRVIAPDLASKNMFKMTQILSL